MHVDPFIGGGPACTVLDLLRLYVGGECTATERLLSWIMVFAHHLEDNAYETIVAVERGYLVEHHFFRHSTCAIIGLPSASTLE